jgi:hypothetical protein
VTTRDLTNRELAVLELQELTLPKTLTGLREWIEVRGTPDYLYRADIHLPIKPESGGIWAVVPPRDLARESAEVQRVYQAQFMGAASHAERVSIVRAFVNHFADLALDPAGWLWALREEWRFRREKQDLELLEALARAVSAPTQTWTKSQARAWTMRSARRYWESRPSSKALGRLYRVCLEGMSSPDQDVRLETERCQIPKLLRRIRKELGCETDWPELEKRKLSGVSRRAIATQLRIPERHLH